MTKRTAGKPKTRRILTLATIEKYDACVHQVGKFKNTFGDKVTITKKLCEKYFDQFDFSWAQDNLLSSAACNKHHKNMQPAWNERYELTTNAYSEWSEGKISTEEYSKIRGDAWTKCRKAVAISFAECYISDGA